VNLLSQIPKSVKGVVFDIGNVLIPYDENMVIQKYLQHSQEQDYEKVYRIVFRNLGVQKLFFTNIITESGFYEETKELIGLNLSKKEFLDIYLSVFKEPESEMLDLFRYLQKNNYQIGIMSNIDYFRYNNLIHKYPWIQEVTITVTSCNTNVLKPDKTMFDIIEKKFNLPGKEILLIDDLINNINAAISYGWNALHYDKYPDIY
jgi:putative hydrolase of the HAD superfamily